jgi:sulfane dehydrogenase subunit SoxC
MSMSDRRGYSRKAPRVEAVAGNGLLHRRTLLGRGAILAGAMGAAPLGSLTGAAAEPSTDTPLTEAP